MRFMIFLLFSIGAFACEFEDYRSLAELMRPILAESDEKDNLYYSVMLDYVLLSDCLLEEDAQASIELLDCDLHKLESFYRLRLPGPSRLESRLYRALKTWGMDQRLFPETRKQL
ncbi:MAG: hypothetical protein A3F09_04675 [Chlamydiae bacterium RIFCSPHIGHO2_12_FULL_49_11]|nr:MAG: hypothetical protein A3F09_04675 [Chlamydiae bacterium RIFCSPHIGHO2_12_FULL_49_11]